MASKLFTLKFLIYLCVNKGFVLVTSRSNFLTGDGENTFSSFLLVSVRKSFLVLMYAKIEAGFDSWFEFSSLIFLVSDSSGS